MIPVIIISVLTFISLVCSVLFFPTIRTKHFMLNSFWVVSMAGALLIVLFNLIDINEIYKGITSSSDVNPLKILTLFISMTILSIFLDEVGFFNYLASLSLKYAKNKQASLFVTLYVVVSILTVFTSNDIIILTFTPFIAYFSKRAKINPIPYLIAEFVAANSWSMMLVIGNPTNIYLATSFNIGFAEYFKVMFIPTVIGSLIGFITLYLIFRKQLKIPITKINEEVKIKDKSLLIIGIIHLAMCTILLAVSSYIDLPMWIISFIFMISLVVFVLIFSLKKKVRRIVLKNTFRRGPWNLIPFLVSMFIIVLSLEKYNVTSMIADLIGNNNIIYRYGIVSFLSSNIINNIPMSVLFSNILATSSFTSTSAVYATIVGSNLGALFTPIGALAGIMWMSILGKLEIKMNFIDFIKYCFIVAILSLLGTLISLDIVFRFLV